MTYNLIEDTDFYKGSHFQQYPPGTEYISSYIEPRVGAKFEQNVFFGLQYWLCNLPLLTQDMIDQAEETFNQMGLANFPRKGWEDILNDYNGYLPIKIEALDEGTVTRPGIPLVQITNTDSRFPWLVGWLETAMLRAVWYGSTVASLSRACKSIIHNYLRVTSDNCDDVLPFALHDFGARGATSREASELGGAAHLVNFMGTDTVAGEVAVRRFYEFMDGAAGFSVPAAEHSTITSWGEDSEKEAYENMIDTFAPGIISIVSDSYDLYNAIENIFGGDLYEKVEALAESGSRLVIRPDSGEPLDVVKTTIEKLMDIFGAETNEKGYRVLPPHIRVLQGDGMNINTIQMLFQYLMENNISAENVVVGMGGGLLQSVTRDTQRFAMKASAICVNGEWRDVVKNPKTDPTKRSKGGLLAVTEKDGEMITVNKSTINDEFVNLFNKVYEVSKKLVYFRKNSFDDVRDRAKL